MRHSASSILKLTILAAGALLLSGCDDTKRKLKESGAEMAEAAKSKIQEVQWDALFAQFESAGLNIRELAGLFASNRWDEAKAWIGKIDVQSTRTVFQTIGEVLYLEELDGVEKCSAKVDEMLADKDISPERKRTLEIMRAYVGGKAGQKTSDIAILIGLAYLSINGFDYKINIHGNKIEVDQLLFLAAVEHARKTLHERTNRPPPDATQTCRATLHQIEAAKRIWALENRKPDSTVPTDADLFGPDAPLREKPKCPGGGTYTLRTVGEPPLCSIPGHTY